MTDLHDCLAAIEKDLGKVATEIERLGKSAEQKMENYIAATGEEKTAFKLFWEAAVREKEAVRREEEALLSERKAVVERLPIAGLSAPAPAPDLSSAAQILRRLEDIHSALEDQNAPKRQRQVTCPRVLGQQLLEATPKAAEAQFEKLFAGFQYEICNAVLNGERGKQLKKKWLAAKSERQLQDVLNELVPDILLRDPNSSSTFFDTSTRGLEGRPLMKIDLIIADRKRVAPHVGTYAELKLNLSSHQAEALGQATEWIQELGEDQKRREYWVFATVGQEHIQFWRLDAKRPFAAYSKKTWRTPMYSFSLDLDNVGFQLFSRWLQTPLEKLGYNQPALPRPFHIPGSQDLIKPTTKLLENASVDAGQCKLGDRAGVIVFQALRAQGSQVVVKVPLRSYLLDREVENLQIVAGLPGVAKHFVRLVGVAITEDLGPARQMMVLEPYAELIPFSIDPCELAKLMRSFVTIVIRLHQSGYMHLDLSYFNLLMYKKQALLADLQTMRPNNEAKVLEYPTGTPMFSGINVLAKYGHSLATECESLFYCTLYILAGGTLPWKGVDNPRLALYSRLGMLQYREGEEVLAKVQDPRAKAMLGRLRKHFLYKDEYRSETFNCDDFLRDFHM